MNASTWDIGTYHIGEQQRLKKDCTRVSPPRAFNSYTYSKTCVKQPLKKDKTKILITIGSLMKVKNIAECSILSILQYF